MLIHVPHHPSLPLPPFPSPTLPFPSWLLGSVRVSSGYLRNKHCSKPPTGIQSSFRSQKTRRTSSYQVQLPCIVKAGTPESCGLTAAALVDWWQLLSGTRSSRFHLQTQSFFKREGNHPSQSPSKSAETEALVFNFFFNELKQKGCSWPTNCSNIITGYWRPEKPIQPLIIVCFENE